MKQCKVIYGDGSTERFMSPSYQEAILRAENTARENGTFIRSFVWRKS